MHPIALKNCVSSKGEQDEVGVVVLMFAPQITHVYLANTMG
jgi:hypothetical protein